ncbi:MAG: type II toxin-antitoxin system VapC family toxin [Acidobacteria bacterium]|nr:type II toxin-antitoxin system VapC family toxin [Acidobacteriota bacterium]
MGLKVYFDTCLAIYLVEEHTVYCEPLEELIASEAVNICSSYLTEMECLVVPARLGNSKLIRKFHDWFSVISLFDLPRGVFEQAALLRAKQPHLRTPDALHLATAIHFGCDEFWTNDNRLASLGGLNVRNVFDTNS